MKILYYPFTDNNKYIEISKQILQSCGCQISPYNHKNLLSLKQHYKAVFFNWYDSINENKSKLKQTVELIKKILAIKLLKLKKTKIVYTFHNKIPHDTQNVKRAKFLQRILVQNSDYIILLSKQSGEYLSDYLNKDEYLKKVRYIPHPNYIGEYSNNLNFELKNNTSFNLLFLGQIRPYKGIEMILSIASKLRQINIFFTIIGNCSDKIYKDSLKKASSKLPNVKIQFEFIKDNDIDEIIRNNDALILPYNTNSSINSGTAILAFSNARTVICPRISTICDFDLNDVYSYTYEDEQEHLMSLEKQTLSAYKDWNENRSAFYNKGLSLYNSVKTNNSIEVLEKKYFSLLQEL